MGNSHLCSTGCTEDLTVPWLTLLLCTTTSNDNLVFLFFYCKRKAALWFRLFRIWWLYFAITCFLVWIIDFGSGHTNLGSAIDTFFLLFLKFFNDAELQGTSEIWAFWPKNHTYQPNHCIHHISLTYEWTSMQSNVLVSSSVKHSTLTEHGAPFYNVLKNDVTCVKVYHTKW